MRAYLRVLGALVWKDLLLELRRRERLAAMGAFAVLVAVLFHYAIDRAFVHPREIAGGLIWLTVVFSGLLGVGRTFSAEEPEGTLEGLLVSPVPRDAVYLGKVVANFILVAVVVLLVVGVFALFFEVGTGGNGPALAGVLGLGTLGFVALATLFSAITSGTRMGESLLPVLVFPLILPVVVFGVTGTNRLLAGVSAGEVAGNLRLLGGFALLALLAGAFLFRFIVED